MGKPKKHQSADAAAVEVNLETKDEGELVSIATVKQMLDVQQSMLKTLFDLSNRKRFPCLHSLI